MRPSRLPIAVARSCGAHLASTLLSEGGGLSRLPPGAAPQVAVSYDMIGTFLLLPPAHACEMSRTALWTIQACVAVPGLAQYQRQSSTGKGKAQAARRRS